MLKLQCETASVMALGQRGRAFRYQPVSLDETLIDLSTRKVMFQSRRRV
jgi:hypothetical protein